MENQIPSACEQCAKLWPRGGRAVGNRSADQAEPEPIASDFVTPFLSLTSPSRRSVIGFPLLLGIDRLELAQKLLPGRDLTLKTAELIGFPLTESVNLRPVTRVRKIVKLWEVWKLNFQTH